MILNFVEFLIYQINVVQKKSAVKELGTQIFERAQKFIDWLKIAEEEDDDDDDEEEEDEVQVVYDERSRPDKIIELEEKKEQSEEMKKSDVKDVDIDIDAI